MMMICAASAFGFYLAWEALPPKLAAGLVKLTMDPTALLLLLNLMLIVLGTAVEGVSGRIILTPVLPAGHPQIGYRPGAFRDHHGDQPYDRRCDAAGGSDDVHQLAGFEGTDGVAYTVEVLPFIGAMMLALVLLTVFPQITLGLPNYVYGTAAG